MTDQSHNQTFRSPSDSGVVGAALLFGVWISRIDGLAGGGMVVRNVGTCIFNAYPLEFMVGWIHVGAA
jgi:hypothetical protein